MAIPNVLGGDKTFTLVQSINSADAQTLQVAALPASCATRFSAEPGQISTPNIRYKTHSLHAVDELTA